MKLLQYKTLNEIIRKMLRVNPPLTKSEWRNFCLALILNHFNSNNRNNRKRFYIDHNYLIDTKTKLKLDVTKYRSVNQVQYWIAYVLHENHQFTYKKLKKRDLTKKLRNELNKYL